MILILLRHGKAEDRAEFGKINPIDGERPLTDKGRREMARAALGLFKVEKKIDFIFTSPLVRAVETAEFLARVAQPGTPFQETSLLSPGMDFSKMLQIAEKKRKQCLVFVGHEPDLSLFASWCLTGDAKSFLKMKKGAACAIEFAQPVAPGRSQLLWHLTNAQLREMT